MSLSTPEPLTPVDLDPGTIDKGRYLRGANPFLARSVYLQPLAVGAQRAAFAAERGKSLIALFDKLALPTAESFIRPPAGEAADGVVLSFPFVVLSATLAMERYILRRLGRIDEPGFATWREQEGAEAVELIWDSRSPTLARYAVQAAFIGLQAMLSSPGLLDLTGSEAFQVELARIRRWTRRHRCSPVASVVARAAQQRGCSHEVLAGNYVRLGQGAGQTMVTEAMLGIAASGGRKRLKTGEQGSFHVLVVDGRIVAARRGPLLLSDPLRIPAMVRDAVRAHAAGQERRVLVIAVPDTDGVGDSIQVTGSDPAPDVRAFSQPGVEGSCPVGAALLDLVLPPGALDRIPSALVLGSRGARRVVKEVGRQLRASFGGVGVATAAETSVQGRPVDRTELGHRGGLDFLLGDPRVDVVLATASPARLLRRGMRIEQVGVTALLGPAEGDREQDYWQAAALAVAVTGSRVLLRSDHPDWERLLEVCPRERIVLLSRRRSDPVLKEHLAAGGEILRPSKGRPAASIDWWRGDQRLGRVPVDAFHTVAHATSGRLRNHALFVAGLLCALRHPKVSG